MKSKRHRCAARPVSPEELIELAPDEEYGDAVRGFLEQCDWPKILPRITYCDTCTAFTISSGIEDSMGLPRSSTAGDFAISGSDAISALAIFERHRPRRDSMG